MEAVCDDVRIVRRAEANRLFREGLGRGMVSSYLIDGLPKYVWAVDEDREVYEAKLGTDGIRRSYHGYRLRSDEDDMRRWVIAEWRRRANVRA